LHNTIIGYVIVKILYQLIRRYEINNLSEPLENAIRDQLIPVLIG